MVARVEQRRDRAGALHRTRDREVARVQRPHQARLRDGAQVVVFAYESSLVKVGDGNADTDPDPPRSDVQCPAGWLRVVDRGWQPPAPDGSSRLPDGSSRLPGGNPRLGRRRRRSTRSGGSSPSPCLLSLGSSEASPVAAILASRTRQPRRRRPRHRRARRIRLPPPARLRRLPPRSLRRRLRRRDSRRSVKPSHSRTARAAAPLHSMALVD